MNKLKNILLAIFILAYLGPACGKEGGGYYHQVLDGKEVKTVKLKRIYNTGDTIHD